MLFNDYIYNSHQTSLRHGFWDGLEVDNITVILSKLALVTSEVGEAVEAVRKNDMSNMAEELADICIRVFDLAGALGLDLEQALQEKMAVNERRPYKHGKLA